MSNHIENIYSELWIKDDILFFSYKDNVTIDLSAAKMIVKDRLYLQQGKVMPVLCDMRGIAEIDKAARDYLALEGSLLIKIVALVVSPPISQLISMFYLKTSAPALTTKVFTNRDDAIAFLKQDKSQNTS